jgi:hypothetical protein
LFEGFFEERHVVKTALSGRFFDCFTGFTGVLLNPTQQFLGLAFDALEFVAGELGSLLFQLALDDVKVTFDFEFGHKFVILVLSDQSHSLVKSSTGTAQRLTDQ